MFKSLLLVTATFVFSVAALADGSLQLGLQLSHDSGWIDLVKSGDTISGTTSFGGSNLVSFKYIPHFNCMVYSEVSE